MEFWFMLSVGFVEFIYVGVDVGYLGRLLCCVRLGRGF